MVSAGTVILQSDSCISISMLTKIYAKADVNMWNLDVLDVSREYFYEMESSSNL